MPRPRGAAHGETSTEKRTVCRLECDDGRAAALRTGGGGAGDRGFSR